MKYEGINAGDILVTVLSVMLAVFLPALMKKLGVWPERIMDGICYFIASFALLTLLSLNVEDKIKKLLKRDKDTTEIFKAEEPDIENTNKESHSPDNSQPVL